MERWTSTLQAEIAGTASNPGTSTRTALYYGTVGQTWPSSARLQQLCSNGSLYGAHGRMETPPRRFPQRGFVSGRTQPSSAAVRPFEMEPPTCKR